MRGPALKCLGGNVMFRLRECVKDATEGASFISFGRLFQARIVEEKNESKRRLSVTSEILNIFRVA